MARLKNLNHLVVPCLPRPSPASPSIHIRAIYSPNTPFVIHLLYMPKQSKRPFFNLTNYAYISLAFFTNLNILHTIIHSFNTHSPQRSHLYSIQSTLILPLTVLCLAFIHQGWYKSFKNTIFPAEQEELIVGEYPLRLTARHLLSDVPQSANSKRKTVYRECYVCKHSTRNPKRRVQTRYWCSHCEVALCPTTCFKIYHTVQKF